MKKLLQIKPLILSRLRKPFDHPEWIFELKHGGLRSVAYVSDGDCKLISRNATVFRRFPRLSESLSKLPVRNAVLDGEIICMDGDDVSVFDQLMFRRGVPYFYAFDLMWLNGYDLRAMRLVERKERLKKLILKSSDPALLYADHVDGYGVDFFRIVCERNLEGIVAKHRASPYSSAAKWIKIKNPAYTPAERRHEMFEKAEHRRTIASGGTGSGEVDSVHRLEERGRSVDRGGDDRREGIRRKAYNVPQ
jgi:bifunctional non-homologous end joining protein LigD